MKRQLAKARKDGYRIVYIDETMFTRTTLPAVEWSLPKENVNVDLDKLKEPTLALLHGISKEKGNEHFQIFDNSVNVAKFKEYLKGLADANPGKKLCIFLDNLSAHRSKKAQAKMRSLGMRWIYNLSYSPEYNPIELVFSKIKSKFKTLRAQKLTGVTQFGHTALIEKAIRNVRKQDVRNCIEHVSKLLA